MPGETIVLDSNLLVLFVVGVTSPAHIARHKRLQAYTERDFHLLMSVLANASGILVTPNTVTETSNLVGQIAEPARSRIYLTFRTLLTETEEIYIESQRGARHPAFPRLGITDAVLLSIENKNLVLLTTDVLLYLEAERQGCKAVNFNHHIEANR
jgi:hypothetical protein